MRYTNNHLITSVLFQLVFLEVLVKNPYDFECQVVTEH